MLIISGESLSGGVWLMWGGKWNKEELDKKSLKIQCSSKKVLSMPLVNPRILYFRIVLPALSRNDQLKDLCHAQSLARSRLKTVRHWWTWDWILMVQQLEAVTIHSLQHVLCWSLSSALPWLPYGTQSRSYWSCSWQSPANVLMLEKSLSWKLN